MNRIPKALVIIPALILALSCGDEAPAEKTIRPVRAMEVAYGTEDAMRTFSGTAQTDKVVNLSFRSSGIITQFNIRLGRRVRRGELLAKLDNVQARLAYEQAVSSLNSAASQMNTAKLSLDRVRALYEKGSASLSDYENAKNSFRTAAASHESAQRSVDIQQEQIRYGFLYAPETGIIASVSAEVDENVSAGQPVAMLNAGADMQIAIGLPESVINRVRQGMAVRITFSSLQGRQYDGTITEVSPSVDPQTATYPVRITLTDPSDEIRSGMTANVTFNFGDGAATENVLIVPAKAVGEDADGRFVFLLEGGNGSVASVRKQHIQVGALSSAGFEVLEGLEAGQMIATAGLQTLLDGQEVRIQ